jgi:regulator of sigma E protease
MSWLFYLAAIPVFAVIVLIHEFGHFITAKWAGIRVEEFGIGFPPRAIGIRRGETIYSINWLPLGGFVRMPGENGELTNAQGTPDPRSFAAKPASKRLIVLVAGVTMNLLLAVALFSVAAAVGQPEDPTLKPAVLGTIESGSPAAQAGLRAGDHVVAVDGHAVKNWGEFVAAVTSATQQAPSGASKTPVTLEITHAGSSEQITVVAQARVHPGPNEGRLGVTPHYVYSRVPLWQAPVAGVQEVGVVVGGIFGAVQQIIRGVLPFQDAFQGPVGIVRTTGQVASTVPQVGWYYILFLTGALSVSLAVVNILPIPALDGGRVLLILVEIARRGKRLSPAREGLINLVGVMALLLLMVAITYSDVSRLFGGH